MKYIATLLLSVLLAACNQPDSTKRETGQQDSTNTQPPVIIIKDSLNDNAISQKDSTPSSANDILLLQASTEVLTAIKARNFEKLSSFVHPRLGVRFSPYAYIDTTSNQLLSATELIRLAKSQKIIRWGIYDGKEEPIKLNVTKYFDRFVYDKDFLNAETKSVNEFKRGGNSLDNLKEVYPLYNATEFYFPGTDPKLGGMDWRLLRLVFKIENKHAWLVAIIHDEWTI